VQAVADFRAEHGRMPESIKELVPKYLSSLPPEITSNPPQVTISISEHSIRFQRNYFLETVAWYSFTEEQEGWEPPVLPRIVPSKSVSPFEPAQR
jgi:hypothetical protein